MQDLAKLTVFLGTQCNVETVLGVSRNTLFQGHIRTRIGCNAVSRRGLTRTKSIPLWIIGLLKGAGRKSSRWCSAHHPPVIFSNNSILVAVLISILILVDYGSIVGLGCSGRRNGNKRPATVLRAFRRVKSIAFVKILCSHAKT